MRVDGRSGRLIRFSGGMRSLKQRSLPLPRSERKVLAMIDAEWLRETCLALRGTSEQIQWGYDLVFKVGERMYAVAPMEPASVCLSFKCSDESFGELTERPGIIPAPYLARAKWVALQTPDAISRNELGELLSLVLRSGVRKASEGCAGEIDPQRGFTKSCLLGEPNATRVRARNPAAEQDAAELVFPAGAAARRKHLPCPPLCRSRTRTTLGKAEVGTLDAKPGDQT
jgi:predicted DNA-binding protein (MmcQ/YjbR family)